MTEKGAISCREFLLWVCTYIPVRLRGPAVEHRSLAGVLSLSCARPVADW